MAVGEIDLEPVPYENGNLIEDEGMLHVLLLSDRRILRLRIPAYRSGSPVTSSP
ncbi:hypothetical protein ACQPZQ_18520 [Pseudonocardia sp. CA-142604]|uniref:hypothetical protein n=1 Tax=Pseudonocardia sp. CA-142604 TaxID=3240024 RepID=UPI003D93C853